MPRLALLTLLLIPHSLAAQAKDWKADAVKYVHGLQHKSGAFLPKAPASEKVDAPTLRATSSALRALHYLGGDLPDKAAVRKYVESCYDDDAGAFADSPGGKTDVFITAVGVMALKEVDAPLEKVKAPIVKYLAKNAESFEDIRIAAAGLERLDAPSPLARVWLSILEKDRDKDGTWGTGGGLARDTASYAVTHLRLGGKLPDRDVILKTIRDGQRPDGGFGKADSESSDLETTYRVMRCFMMLKEQPRDGTALRGFILKCRNKDGGFGAQPGQPSNVGATYFAAIVDHWLK